MNPFGAEQWQTLFSDFHDVFLTGFLHTFYFSVCGLILALAIGVVLGVFSVTHNGALKAIARVYVEFFQNTPLFLQLIFMYNVLPNFGIVLDVIPICILGVGMYHGAYISEVVRTGIQSVPKGQMEAAMSQGFTFVQAMRMIVLPQAVKVMLPMLTNQAVNLVKNTSVTAMIAGGELMYLTDSWVGLYQVYGPGYLMAGVLYFVINFPLVSLTKYLEKRAKRGMVPKRVKRTEKILIKEGVANGGVL